ncbi:MAG: malate dehydrogenase [Parachlamydia sp.]|jgi:malate dehydrogenase|nr:malate dehydrogenase [Parachlamydia sp.]
MGGPLKIAVSGGAGQIAYSLLFKLAAGNVFGPDQTIALILLEVPDALGALEGVKMELEDCAFPLLSSLALTSSPYEAFADADYALLIGAKPRSFGMERKDLLEENGKIFVEQGKALNESAQPNCKVFVVGNPCNTNCLIALSHAPRLSEKNFFAMMRLDQNRAASLLARQANVPLADVKNIIVWGNHSSTQVPDYLNATIKGKAAQEIIQPKSWLQNEFIPAVQQRGAAVIKARGKSSAASAAHALSGAIRDQLHPTTDGKCYSSGIYSKGNPYGIDPGLIFSFPCQTDKEGDVSITQGFQLDQFLLEKIKLSEKELIEERELVKSLLGTGVF